MSAGWAWGAGWVLGAVVAVGWLWGSFLNQVVDRTPFAPGAAARGKPQPPGSLLDPRRSLCLHCGVPIAWYDNLPLFSYLALRGRCRRCGAAIGLRTLAVEAAVPLLVGALHLALGWWAVAGWGLFAVSAAVLGLAWRWEGRRPPRRWLAAGALWGLISLGFAAWWGP